MVAFTEAVTAWVAHRQVTPTTSPALPEGQAVRLPDGTAATVVKAWIRQQGWTKKWRAGRRLRQVALFQLPDTSSIAESGEWRVPQTEPSLAVRDGPCSDGRRGRTRRADGDLACYVSPTSPAFTMPGSPWMALVRPSDRGLHESRECMIAQTAGSPGIPGHAYTHREYPRSATKGPGACEPHTQ